MKKVIVTLAVAALVMLGACKNEKQQGTAGGNNQQQTEQADDIQFPTAETADPEKEQDEWTMQNTIKSSKPMLVDFFADWCGPCKQLAPIMDELEKKYHGQVIFKRVNVDDEAALAQEFGIEAIPTLMFITPRGEYVSMVGYHEAPDIEARIGQLLVRSTAK